MGGCGAVKIESVQGPPTFLRRPLGHSVIREDMTLEVPSMDEEDLDTQDSSRIG